MSTKGRKPKPTNLRLLEGNREHRPIPNNPDPAPVNPYAPKWMHEYGKQEWRRISKVLHRLGLLTVMDTVSLTAYCQTYAKWRIASEKAEITTFETEAGYVGQNPYINMEIKYSKEMRAWLTEFGMTPSSRAKIDIEDLRDDDEEWSDLIGVR